MTRTEALARITAKANEMGLKSGDSEWNNAIWVSVTGQPGYIHISITENYDTGRCDYANGIYAGHFTVSAEVSRMGGAPTPDELFAAADEIRLAAEFAKACEDIDLSYREDTEGNAA